MVCMDKYEEVLIEKHIAEDQELRKYVDEHRQFEADLENFNRLNHLTPEEEIMRKVLQKKKLLGMEKIFTILERYRPV
jgi:hypothetical protein